LTRDRYPDVQILKLTQCVWPAVADLKAHLQQFLQSWVVCSPGYPQVFIELGEGVKDKEALVEAFRHDRRAIVRPQFY
jgi:hypothetical protein